MAGLLICFRPTNKRAMSYRILASPDVNCNKRLSLCCPSTGLFLTDSSNTAINARVKHPGIGNDIVLFKFPYQERQMGSPLCQVIAEVDLQGLLGNILAGIVFQFGTSLHHLSLNSSADKIHNHWSRGWKYGIIIRGQGHHLWGHTVGASRIRNSYQRCSRRLSQAMGQLDVIDLQWQLQVVVDHGQDLLVHLALGALG